jgi:microtubule-binding protein TANGLED1
VFFLLCSTLEFVRFNSILDSWQFSDSCRRRMRGGTSAQKRSPNVKFGGVGASGGEGAQWWRMSLPAMLLGQTVLEIVQASRFVRDIVTAAGAMNQEPPRTPKPAPRTRKPTAAAAPEQTPLRARRAREKHSH